MKEWKRSAIVFFGESALGENIGGRPGKFALGKIIQHRLKITSRGSGFIEGAIGLSEEEKRIGASGRRRMLVEIFLKLGNSEIILLLRKQAVGIVELPLR